MSRWEVFKPQDGQPVYTFRWRWVARVVAKVTGMDYALTGEGW